MRDGVQLSATLYLPKHQKSPSPAIFVFTPYVRQVHHDQGVFFAARGYPFLSIDVRGRGDSQGEAHPLNESKTDGYDIVEWIACQPYCNGKVAMWGGSYSGLVQWNAAKERPPHLATIVPVASPYRGVDGPARYNIFAPYRLQWLTFISGRTSQDKIFADQSFWSGQFKQWFEAGVPFKSLDTFVGNPLRLFQEWVSYPEQCAYWDSYNPTPEHYSKLTLPILTITGSYDSNQPGALAHYREHMKHASSEGRGRHYLIIGPWDHAGTRIPKAEFGGLNVGAASLVDLPQLHLDWYAWTLQGGPKPQFLKNRVAYYVMVADKWRYSDTLEGITARAEPLYLHSTANPTDVFHSGSLESTPPAESAPDHYVYDPKDVSLAKLESTLDPASLIDQRMLHARAGKHLVYHSAPFEKDTEISGFFKITAWLSIDQPDTDFSMSVHDVALDGSSVLLTNDVLRARYRESLREAKLVTTREPLRYDFERFMFVSRQINKGHRLRLVIGPLNSIFWQKNYNSGGVVSDESLQDARPVNVRLFHDEARPSALYVPLAHSEN